MKFPTATINEKITRSVDHLKSLPSDKSSEATYLSSFTPSIS